MKNNILWTIILILIAFLSFGVGRQVKKTSIGRFRLYFGEILETTTSAGADSKIQESKETIPVCIRLDTKTGQTWIYKKSFDVINTGDDVMTLQIDGFELMPFEGGEALFGNPNEPTVIDYGTLNQLDWIRYRFPYYAELNDEELLKYLHKTSLNYRKMPYGKFRNQVFNSKK